MAGGGPVVIAAAASQISGSISVAAMQNTLSVASFNLILHLAGQYGLRPEELCRQLEVDSRLLGDPDARLPTRKVQELWRLAIGLTGNPHLPLYLGQSVNLYAMGMLAYLLMHCPTLGEVLEKLCHYQDIACEGVRTTPEKHSEGCLLKLQVTDEEIVESSYALDSEMSVYRSMMGSLTGGAFSAEAIHFAYPLPGDREEYGRVFGTSQLHFRSAFTGIVFRQEMLRLPVLNANPALFPVFEKHAREYLQKLKGSNTLSYRVRQEIYRSLKGEEPGLPSIARSLAMSERSIQLRLKEENVTYRQLLDEVRKETAISHLKEPNLSITDIAYLLGFSEPAVFSRTFRKWTGSTPQAFRRQNASGTQSGSAAF